MIDHLELDPGISFWWSTLLAEKCNSSKSPCINSIIRILAFDLWVKEKFIKKIKLFTSDLILIEALEIWCSQKSIKFSYELINDAIDLGRKKTNFFKKYFPHDFQAILWIGYYIHRRWRLFGVGVSEWKKTNGKLTFVSYLFNLSARSLNQDKFESHYWWKLPDLLNKELCTSNWLHIYVESSLVPDAAEAARILKIFNADAKKLQTHVTLDSFFSLQVFFNTFIDWFFLRRVAKKLEPHLCKSSNLTQCLWPLLADDWQRSFNGRDGLKAILHINLFMAALELLPKQERGVFLQENQGWEFSFIGIWKNLNNGDLIGVPHSTVRYWDLRYFFDQRSYIDTGINKLPTPDFVALNGLDAQQAYLNGGYPKGLILMVEALRYMVLAKSATQLKTKNIDTNTKIRLLVVGDYLRHNSDLQMNLLARAVCNVHGGCKVILKSHPACLINIEDYSIPEMELSNKSLDELLLECDVVYTSAVTSGAVDAYCLGLPVISLFDASSLNLSPLRGRKDVVFVNTPEDLANAINTSIHRPNQGQRLDNFFLVDSSLERWRELLLHS